MKGKVLVTGGGGYIGSVLVEQLLDADYEAVALDRFYFGEDLLNHLSGRPGFSVIKKDIRDAVEEDFAGVTAVCDLAALSNDPAGDIDPELTEAINHRGRVNIAKRAKNAGVPRYVLSSSCSIYGHGKDLELTEDAPTNPLTIYAKANRAAEVETMELSDSSFSVTALRNSTVFGLSPRMRFDLVINLMTLHAFDKNRITIMGGGRQWRPLVHVSDVARAFRSVIEADTEKVNGEVFNVGLANFQIRSLAYNVRENVPFPVEVLIAPDDADKRDYNVSFEKARKVLWFEAQTGIPEGVREIYEALKMAETEFSLKTKTVDWYRNILNAKALIDSIEIDGRIL